jgi:hypothetical protein
VWDDIAPFPPFLMGSALQYSNRERGKNELLSSSCPVDGGEGETVDSLGLCKVSTNRVVHPEKYTETIPCLASQVEMTHAASTPPPIPLSLYSPFEPVVPPRAGPEWGKAYPWKDCSHRAQVCSSR